MQTKALSSREGTLPAVSLSATFKTLPSGLTHMAFGEVLAPAKSLSVQMQDFDYNRNN